MDWIDYLPEVLTLSRALPNLPAEIILEIASFSENREYKYANEREINMQSNGAVPEGGHYRNEDANDLGYDIVYLQGKGESVHPPPEVLEAYSTPDALEKVLQAYVRSQLPQEVALPPLFGQGYGIFDRVMSAFKVINTFENPYLNKNAHPAGSLDTPTSTETANTNDAGAHAILQEYIGTNYRDTLLIATVAPNSLLTAAEMQALCPESADTASAEVFRPVIAEGFRQLVPPAVTSNPFAVARARHTAAQLHALHLSLTRIACEDADAPLPPPLPITHRPYVGSPLALRAIEGHFVARDQGWGNVKGNVYLVLNRPSTGQQWRWPIVYVQNRERGSGNGITYLFKLTREQLVSGVKAEDSNCGGWGAADRECSEQLKELPFHNPMFDAPDMRWPVSELSARLREDTALAAAAAEHVSSRAPGAMPADFWSIRAAAGGGGGHSLHLTQFEVRLVFDAETVLKNDGGLLHEVIRADRVRQHKATKAPTASKPAFVLEDGSVRCPLLPVASADIPVCERTTLSLRKWSPSTNAAKPSLSSYYNGGEKSSSFINELLWSNLIQDLARKAESFKSDASTENDEAYRAATAELAACAAMDTTALLQKFGVTLFAQHRSSSAVKPTLALPLPVPGVVDTEVAVPVLFTVLEEEIERASARAYSHDHVCKLSNQFSAALANAKKSTDEAAAIPNDNVMSDAGADAHDQADGAHDEASDEDDQAGGEDAVDGQGDEDIEFGEDYDTDDDFMVPAHYRNLIGNSIRHRGGRGQDGENHPDIVMHADRPWTIIPVIVWRSRF